MSYVKIWIHAVWATKNRAHILENPQRQQLFRHLHSRALHYGIAMEIVNGYTNHVHCLYRLPGTISVSKSVQWLKGESSHWANERGLFQKQLNWQSDYYAVSVSESQTERVHQYIAAQESYHANKSFEQEEMLFVRKYGFRLE